MHPNNGKQHYKGLKTILIMTKLNAQTLKWHQCYLEPILCVLKLTGKQLKIVGMFLKLRCLNNLNPHIFWRKQSQGKPYEVEMIQWLKTA